jgi:hypothetical protein
MSARLPEIKLALSVDFLEAFSAIPKRQQAHVRQFIDSFRRNPTASGHNYEVIRDARDPNLRSVRIDGTYRAIVLKPETGNVYALLWVDHHDDAYAWARNRRVRIDVATGALQVVPVEVAAPEVVVAPRRHVTPPDSEGPAEVAPAAPAGPLFATHPDEVLLGFGLPPEFLPVVRGLTTDAALDGLVGTLPAEVYEALSLLYAGFEPEDVRAYVAGDARPSLPADPTDFAAAFANPQTLRRFAVVEDDAALAEILDAPLARWRVFLHPSQRKLVEARASGPVRVLGGAGTGKTVVAMHRAAHLATRVFTAPTDRILFTTFTRNLAGDIAQQLGAICPAEARARIEVIHLDQWVRDFLARQGFAYTVAYAGDEAREKAWRAAVGLLPVGVDLSPTFLREEFDKVVVPHGVLTAAEYFAAPRLGRGTALSRKERAAIWPVFEDYRRRLADARAIEIGDAMREARMLLKRRGDLLPYRAVLVDEAQDFGAQAFRLLRQIVGPERENDMFIVGDAHQRIYGQPVVLSRCGVNVRGRASTLKINYRTTDEIRAWAVRLLAGLTIDDLDGGLDEGKGYKSLLHGEPPALRAFSTREAEVDAIVARLRALEGAGAGALEATCLVARSNAFVQAYAEALQEQGVPTFVLGKDGDDPRAPGVRLATMHRVKGLEFERVWIAGVNEGAVPPATALAAQADEAAREELVALERALLYVAATRAKREAVVSWVGVRSGVLGG